MRKDQERALTAFKWAQSAVDVKEIEGYETAVQTFAATLIRSGLAVAVSVLQRDAGTGKDSGPGKESRRLLVDLAFRYSPAEGQPVGADAWPAAMRAEPDTATYMMRTREMVAFLTWLRRACRAVQPKMAQL